MSDNNSETSTTTNENPIERYIAFRDKEGELCVYEIMNALDQCGFTYDHWSWDDDWSVLAIQGASPRGSYEKTFEAALQYRGVDA